MPRAVFAQPKKAPVVVGWLSITSPDRNQRELTAFKETLAKLGWKDGANVVIEARWAEGRPDRIPLLIEVLVLKKSAVVVTLVGAATGAMAKAVPSIPVVQLDGGSPVESRLAASLPRPGGMVTGLTNLSGDLIGKRSELLVDTLPDIQRIGYLLDSNVHNRRAEFVASARQAAAQLKRQSIIAEAGKAEELEAAFSEFRKSAAQGIVVLPGTYLGAETRRIMQLALKHRLPFVVGRRDAAEAGALISYGHDPIYNATRAAWYVDQILKGAKPGALPIEQPSKFELVVNLKTAKALGISVPQLVLVRADHVIQ